MENNHTKNRMSGQKKQSRKIISWTLAVVLVLMLAVMPMMAAKNDAEQEQTASILSGTVEYGSIDTQIIGGGQLASEAAVKLKIPEEIKLKEYLVSNGDIVSTGDPIAKIDRVSVMTAIVAVQETLDELSKEILDAEDDQSASTVKSKVGGTVKAIYVEAGESVQEAMLEHGALVVISLDDLMAVKIACQSGLDVGDSVNVMFSDDTTVVGRVEQNLEGILTVTIEDDAYAIGETVTIFTEDGNRLGRGNLYVFNQWNATAYSGTVSSVLVKEGAALFAGQDLIRLDNQGYTSEFQRLIDKRQVYEELMQELFLLYRTETITAPCDGIVSGVDKDGAFLLNESGDNYLLSFLTERISADRDLFEARAVQVDAITDDGMQMRVSGKRSWIENMYDLSGISVIPEQLSYQWDYSCDTTVYVQTENGILHADGTAKPGDFLVAIGDAKNVLWFVRANMADGSQNGGLRAEYLSDTKKSGSDSITLHISNDLGTANKPFSAELEARIGGQSEKLSGTWFIEDSGFTVKLENNMISGTPTQAGDYEITVVFVAEDEETIVRKTFTITIVAPYELITREIPNGAIGIPYSFYLEVSGSENGRWSAENLPGGLALNEETGEISGVPVMEGVFTVKVQYSDQSLGDLNREYQFIITKDRVPGNGGGMTGGMGGFSGGGMAGGMMPGGSGQEEDPYYSMEKLTIASVTSQEQMTVEILVDELDITKIYIGQSAVVTIDALAGERYTAVVTKIANSGENEGGNSKFSVELTLDKSGNMLPGMTASARILLDTVSEILCIPAAALTEENGKLVVYTSLDPENMVLGNPVEVTIGVADADHVQVLSGLEAGDTFYYSYYDKLEGNVVSAMGAPFFS